MYGSWVGQWAWTGSDIMWMFITFLIGVGVTTLWFWARKRNIVVKWWDWLIGAIGLLLLMLAIQNITAASYEEVMSSVPWFLLVFGLPGLILLAVSGQLVWRRHRSA